MNQALIQAEILIMEGELEEAGEIIREVLQEEPDNLDAILCQGIIFSETKESDKAIRALEYYISREKSKPEAWEALGCSWFRKGDYGKAREFLETALALDINSSTVLRNLGILEEVTGHYEKAFLHLERSFKENANDYRTVYALGYAYLNRRNYEQSKKFFTQLLSLNIPAPIREEAAFLLLKLDIQWH